MWRVTGQVTGEGRLTVRVGALGLAAWLSCLLAMACAPRSTAPGSSATIATASKHLVIVLDGLRPDYVTPELMPNLAALAERGVFFERHHAVFPTVTRVNASSIATGAYPEAHGLLHNVVYFPAVDDSAPFSTGDRDNLLRIAAVEERLLEATTLGETLASAGRTLFVASTGSTGSSFLLNPVASRESGAGSFIVHPEYTEPAEIEDEVRRRLGEPPPEEEEPERRQRLHRWAMRAVLELGLDRYDADTAIVWLADPDSTAHAYGIGSAEAERALRVVDGELAWLSEQLEERELAQRVNLLVTTDHGFSTQGGAAALDEALEDVLGSTLADGSRAFVAAHGWVYLAPEVEPRLAEVVSGLRRLSWVGAMFTVAKEPGSAEGEVPGTLSFDVMRGDHRRRGQLYVDVAWSDEANEHGYSGHSAFDGVAGHGSSSPWDIHATLVAAGPDFKTGLRSAVPSSNVDLAPTLLHLLGLGLPETMQGRVLAEALRDGPAPSEVEVVTRRLQAVAGAYEVEAVETEVEGRRYMQQTEVHRR